MGRMHIIRLRHPWQKLIAGASEPVRVRVPEPVTDDQTEEHCVTRATYTRSFNRPTGLEPDSSVLLRLDRWQGKLASISLNGEAIVSNVQPQLERLEINITAHLANRNELTIVLASESNTQVRLGGEVLIAIID